MIRINRILEGSSSRLVVEGTLSGAAVDELEKCWLELNGARAGGPFGVDLSGVRYIDEKGQQLLKRMFCEGADLQATGVMTRGIIEEIARETASSELSEEQTER